MEGGFRFFYKSEFIFLRGFRVVFFCITKEYSVFKVIFKLNLSFFEFRVVYRIVYFFFYNSWS